MATYIDYSNWIYVVSDDALDQVPESYHKSIRCSKKIKKPGIKMKVLAQPKNGRCPK